MIHETVTYQAFHDMGVPAPHTGFTYLTVNGKSYGLHLNIETQDAQSLENEFGDSLHGPAAAPLRGRIRRRRLARREGSAPRAGKRSKSTEGKKKEKGDLAALLAAVEATTPELRRSESRRSPTSSEMTKDVAGRKVRRQLGRLRRPVARRQPSEQLLPLQRRRRPLPDDALGDRPDLAAGPASATSAAPAAPSSPTASRTPPAANRSTGPRAAKRLTALSASSLDAVARCTAAALRPWQEFEAATSEERKAAEPECERSGKPELAEAEVAATREFIETRPADLAAYLGEPVPKPAATNRRARRCGRSAASRVRLPGPPPGPPSSGAGTPAPRRRRP